MRFILSCLKSRHPCPLNGHAFIFVDPSAITSYSVTAQPPRSSAVVSSEDVTYPSTLNSTAKDNNLPDAYLLAPWSEIIGFAIPPSNSTPVNPKTSVMLVVSEEGVRTWTFVLCGAACWGEKEGEKWEGLLPLLSGTGDDLSRHCWNRDGTLSRYLLGSH